MLKSTDFNNDVESVVEPEGTQGEYTSWKLTCEVLQDLRPSSMDLLTRCEASALQGAEILRRNTSGPRRHTGEMVSPLIISRSIEYRGPSMLPQAPHLDARSLHEFSVLVPIQCAMDSTLVYSIGSDACVTLE